jgi:alpha-tubulin suppressor-like RCC1 family protein
VRISAGFFHTCQVNEDGTVRCWGSIFLGGTTASSSSTPALVSGITNAVVIADGNFHTCALLSDGTAKCWGLNDFGQLGDGTTTPRLTPVAVIGLSNAVAIAAGNGYTCALLANGTAKCWGFNDVGQLGDTTTTERHSPVGVFGLSNAIAITASRFSGHTCALLAGGTAKCWGYNFSGQLGDRTTTERHSPVVVFGVDSAVAIAAGGDEHTCALLADGTAKCWGRNTFGQLGDGTTDGFLDPRPTSTPVQDLSNAVAITTGFQHTCALLADGTAKCWGRNELGQLGDGTKTERHRPVAVGVPLSSLNNAVAIAAGGNQTCALLADGSATCWGNNLNGELGSGVFPDSSAPVAVTGGGGSFTARDIAAGRNHTCAVRANSTVSCWGSNDSGQIGDGTIGGTRLSPVAVPNLNNVVAIAAGEAHTCALLANGTAKCWGANGNGQLGDAGASGSLSRVPVLVSGLTNAVAIAAGGALGSSHTCALLANGTARCWGANGSGQLGDAGVSGFLSPVPVLVSGFGNGVSIAVGETHTCALVAVGVPFCWGFNGSGQLGTSPPLATQLTPTLVSLDNVVAIAGGNLHTCALQADGSTWCWGGNLLGQLGINSTVSPQSAPRLIVDVTNALVTSAVAIAGGFGHSCALVAAGGAKCWGENSSGQLGNNTLTASLTPTDVTVLTKLASRTGGFTFVLSPIRNTVNITAGRRHSCVLFANGGVSCWGENTFGQLGIGSTTNQFSPVTVPSFTLNIDPEVTVEHNDRVSTVTILATCEAGQRLHVDVTLIQGAVSGHGVGAGECTGGLEGYPVTVPAQGRNPFIEGPAAVEAEARILDRGFVVDTQEWTREVQVVSAP